MNAEQLRQADALAARIVACTSLKDLRALRTEVLATPGMTGALVLVDAPRPVRMTQLLRDAEQRLDPSPVPVTTLPRRHQSARYPRRSR